MNVMSTPRSVDLDITGRCNLRCVYCYHFSGPGEVTEDLPKAEWLSFFEELRHCAVMSVTLSGGEPFLRKDLKELIAGIVENRMRFSILSNGTLITDDIAEFLFFTDRCDGVQVSVDGSEPEIHDRLRGSGNFSRAIAGIRCLQQHHLPVQVRVTINRHNITDLESIAALLLEDLGLSTFSTNAASYMGLCRQNHQHVGLTSEDRALAMKILMGLNKKYADRISANAGPLAEIKMWTEMELARAEKRAPFPAGGYLTACGCVQEKIAVRADGFIVPCTMLSHIELGRINRDDFKDIWQNHPEMKKMRQRASIPLGDFAFCRQCGYIPYCTGNCPGLAYTITGDVHHPSPDACLRSFFEAGGSLPGKSIYE